MLTTYRNWLVLFAALIGCSALILGELHRHDWAFDDEDYIENARKAQDDFGYIFSADKPWAARPTVHFFFWAIHPFGQTQPGRYHLANVALHTLNALLCAALFHYWGGRFITAMLGAALFLFDPSAFRAVYWISGVSLTLATGLSLVSLLTLSRTLQGGRLGWLGLSALSFALALFAHSAALGLLIPLGLMVLRTPKNRLALLAPYLLAATALLAANCLIYPTPLNTVSEFAVGAHVPVNFFHMVFRLLVAARLDLWWITWSVHVQMIIGLVLCAILIYLARRSPQVRYGSIWVFCALLPFALWPPAADVWRYYYPAAVGGSFLVAHGLVWIGGRTREALAVLLGVALLLASLARVDEAQAVQFGFSGLYFAKSGRCAQALQQYQQALALAPDLPLAISWRYHRAICLLAVEQIVPGYTALLEILPAVATRAEACAYLLQAHIALFKPTGAQIVNGEIILDAVGQKTIKGHIDRYLGNGQLQAAKSLCLAYLHYFPTDLAAKALLQASQSNRSQ